MLVESFEVRVGVEILALLKNTDGKSAFQVGAIFFKLREFLKNC